MPIVLIRKASVLLLSNMFQKPSKFVLLISFILALSVQTVTFALDGSILDSISALLGSASSDQSFPASSAPSQSGVKPSFQRVVVGVDGGDSQVFLGDDEVSGIVSQRTVGLGIETSGLLGTVTGSLGNSGLFVENTNGIGVLGLSSSGTGIVVTDADDIGIYSSGSSLGFYSKNTDIGITVSGNTYGGVLGTSTDGTGIISLGNQYGVKSSDGSFVGADGIGIYSANNAFIGDEYTIFSLDDATLSGELRAALAKADLAEISILDADSGIASSSSLTLTGSLQVAGNDISVAEGVTIDGGLSPSYIGGILSFLNPSTSSVQIGPESTSVVGIDDDAHIQGNLYAERNITAQSMGNITIHDNPATGSYASVSCASQETLMGCGASIDGGTTDITEVYPSSNYCNAQRSSGDASYPLRVYAYCFEPLGDGSSDSCDVPPAPTGLGVKQDNDTLTFSWSAVLQADSYCLKFDDARGEEILSFCYTGTKTSFTKDLDDFKEGTYSFAVAAKDTSCGLGPYSDPKSFTVRYPDEPGSLCDPDHYDPDLCAKIHIDFDPDFSDAGPDYRAPIDWYWEATCEPDCTSSIVEVTGTDCSGGGGAYCPDYMTTSGDVLTDRTSMIEGWNGLDYSSGDAVGDLSVTGLAYMIQAGEITATEAAYISDQGLVDDAMAILDTSHFGSDGSLVSGQWTGHDTYVDGVSSILDQIGTYDTQTQTRSQVDQTRGGF